MRIQMMYTKDKRCPICGGDLFHYDTLDRQVRTEFGRKEMFKIRRMRCRNCGYTHRELIRGVMIPYKQYHAEIIEGVLDGVFTGDELYFEDYPSASTIRRWLDSHFLLGL